MKLTMTLTACAFAAGLLTFGALTSRSHGGDGRAEAPAADAAPGRPLLLWALRGTHGYSYSGTVIGLPIAAAGPITFDGAGQLSAKYSVSLNGQPFQGSFTGTYTVNPDLTGTVTLNLPLLGLSSRGSFVIVSSGRETYFTGTDPGVTITGTTKRQ